MAATFKEYVIEVGENHVRFPNGEFFEGLSIARHLKGCKKCAVLAATLGASVDRELRKLQLIDMAQALEYDKKSNAEIERVVDEVQEQIRLRAEVQNLFITSRFSPGYGDLSLETQKTVLRLTNAEKEIGLTLTESLLLVPQKSVTAIIGYSEHPTEKTDKCKDCPSKKKCKETNV